MTRLPPAPGREVTVVSYNVHGFIGADRRFDPQRSFRVIESLDAELVALQEVHSLVRETQACHFAGLAEKAGFRVLLGGALVRRGAAYGNALLVRQPTRRLHLHDLRVGSREPRRCLDAELDWGGLRVRVIATHLGLGRVERRRQIERLCHLLDETPGGETDLTLLLGDLNAWGPSAAALGPLARRLGGLPRRPTFPSRWPLLALDRIGVQPAAALRELSPVSGPEVREASDHLPLRARLRLPSPSDS